MTDTVNLVFAGVGGQGVLLIAEITAQAALRAGLDVKQTEVHGVSQRGGSVESHVRFGREVHSPLVIAGQADVVIGMEKLEALRYARFARLDASRPGGVLVNDHEIIPGSVVGAQDKYPYHALDFLRQKGVQVVALPASRRARELGDGRVANLIMLGALTTRLPQIPDEAWQAVLEVRVPPKYRELNFKAFETGKELISLQHLKEVGEVGVL